MADFPSTKMKRKEIDGVYEDFSDFSLSSPARKIRRLDAELPPIMEEEEPDVPLVFKQSTLSDDHISGNMEQLRGSGPVIEELPTVPENEERALVLFNPMNTPLLQSPSTFHVSVNSDILSGIKNQILWSRQSNAVKSAEEEAARQDSSSGGTRECLAVVPWVPSQFPHSREMEIPQTDMPESMDAEDMEEAKMDIEENNVVIEPGQEFGGMRTGEGIRQWQQQHCMTPQLPQNPSTTPIVWYQ